MLKLNLGSGNDYKKGYINIDRDESKKPDIAIDIEKGLPFKDNTADYILCSHILEHLLDLNGVMKEMHRVVKPTGMINIFVPHFSSYTAFYEEHLRFFRSISLRLPYFIREVHIEFGKGLKFWNHLVEWFVNLNEKTQRVYEITALRNLIPAESIKIRLFKVVNG